MTGTCGQVSGTVIDVKAPPSPASCGMGSGSSGRSTSGSSFFEQKFLMMILAEAVGDSVISLIPFLLPIVNKRDDRMDWRLDVEY